MNMVSRSSAASPARISTFAIVSPVLEVLPILRTDIVLIQHNVGLGAGGIPQNVVVTLVAQGPGCFVERHPARVVGFVVEAELARLDLHQPVPRALAAALGVPVGRRRELAPERAAEAGLLLDLAQGALLLA